LKPVIFIIHQPDALEFHRQRKLEHLDDPRAALKELKQVAQRYVLLSVPHESGFV
jgi:hypothetical protein